MGRYSSYPMTLQDRNRAMESIRFLAGKIGAKMIPSIEYAALVEYPDGDIQGWNTYDHAITSLRSRYKVIREEMKNAAHS